MPNVYDPDEFMVRVNFAAATITRGGAHTRRFDTCFEMYDGDLVVTALVRRADKNPNLRDAITRQWRGTFPQSWLDSAAKYASVPTRELKREAAKMRASRSGN